MVTDAIIYLTADWEGFGFCRNGVADEFSIACYNENISDSSPGSAKVIKLTWLYFSDDKPQEEICLLKPKYEPANIVLKEEMFSQNPAFSVYIFCTIGYFP